MAKYRKKPVVIEAVQWTGDNLDEVRKFLGGDFLGVESDTGQLGVGTLEDGFGGMTAAHIASLYDFLIEGVQGEHYACKSDIFEATYEPV